MAGCYQCKGKCRAQLEKPIARTQSEDIPPSD